MSESVKGNSIFIYNIHKLKIKTLSDYTLSDRVKSLIKTAHKIRKLAIPKSKI